ncbi:MULTISPECIES: transposase [unclassified Mesorhizobium]|uniref:transposase n=1 Tax=unclassified Mesorhizobium TaxID=325217 RepID=UPI003335DC34
MLGGGVGERCRELLQETARARDGHSCRVDQSRHLKGRSSHKLLIEFGIFRKRYWGQHLWARGYWLVRAAM